VRAPALASIGPTQANGASPRLHFFSSSVISIFACVRGLLQELFPVIFLSHQIERLEDSWFKSLSHGEFLNAPTRCSVKCL
jgi:hypothetical protein